MPLLPFPESVVFPLLPVVYALAWGLVTGAVIGFLRQARSLLGGS